MTESFLKTLLIELRWWLEIAVMLAAFTVFHMVTLRQK